MIVKSGDCREEGFKPVSLTLTFTSQKELDAFSSIFHWTVVTDAIKRGWGFSWEQFSQPIYVQAKEIGAKHNMEDWGRFINIK